MVDREKVIKGLECCSQMAGEFCRKCPYANDCGEGLSAGTVHLAADALALIREQEFVKPKWVSVKDRLPESGKHVFVTCEIRSLYGDKKRYVCEAYYAAEHSISEGKYLDDTDCYNYFEEDDEYYLKEGWYEVIHNWDDEYGSVVIGDCVTHWMELPEPAEELMRVDREKIKTGIFEMLQRNTWKDIDKERHRFQPVLNDALSLLKEQEPVKPRYEDFFGNRIARCGYCNAYIVGCYKYCPGCGRAVKWDGDYKAMR